MAPLCVVHVAAVQDAQALEALARSTQVIAARGVGQVLLALEDGPGSDTRWAAEIVAEVRLLRFSGLSIVRRVRELQAEFARLLRDKALCAVHLHGLGPCLLALQALKGSALQARLLYSPHHERLASPWAAALVGRVLQSQLARFHYAPLAASLTEAHALSKMLNRSAEILPHPVREIFFAASRREDPRPSILAHGAGPEAVDLVSRLCVLLNGRKTRVWFSWLGAAPESKRAQLEAARVQLVDGEDCRQRAQSLSRAWLFVEIALRGQQPLVVAEAMAAGVPCLVSDVAAHRALIHHGETGFVCTSERDFLERAIVLLRDREERWRVGQAARAEAQRRFTPRHFESAILRAYGFSAAESLEAGAADLAKTL